MRKYPFTPELLDALPERVAELLRGLETEVLRRICEGLNASGKLNSTNTELIRLLRSHGIPLKEIEDAISMITGKGADELNRIFDEAVAFNEKYYGELLNMATLTAPQRLVSHEDIDTIYRQTLGEYKNITRSMGFAVPKRGTQTVVDCKEAYTWALDNAAVQVSSDAVSYNEAIRGAVKRLADSGLKTVDYASGHVDSVDVAVRRAVMTGVSQLCDRYTEQAAERIGTHLYEISAHRGARDKGVGWQNHKSWQGKVYSTEDDDKYPSIYEVCGLGKVDGLEGANCRHRRFAFVDGVSQRTYTDEELEKIDPPPFEYEGKEYTAYEATQKQRQIERTVRKLKRERDAYKAAGLDDDARAVNVKIRRLSRKYKEFSAAAGLPEQRERMRVYFGNDVEKTSKNDIIKERHLAMGFRKPISHVLTESEIADIKSRAERIGIDTSLLRFNEGFHTGFFDSDATINVRGDILPDEMSSIARDKMSVSAVLAHEYYGHFKNHPSEYNPGDWRDEFRASYLAAVNTPNLSDEDRALLMIDAYDRAREAGQIMEYDKTAKEIIYGFK